MVTVTQEWDGVSESEMCPCWTKIIFPSPVKVKKPSPLHPLHILYTLHFIHILYNCKATKQQHKQYKPLSSILLLSSSLHVLRTWWSSRFLFDIIHNLMQTRSLWGDAQSSEDICLYQGIGVDLPSFSLSNNLLALAFYDRKRKSVLCPNRRKTQCCNRIDIYTPKTLGDVWYTFLYSLVHIVDRSDLLHEMLPADWLLRRRQHQLRSLHTPSFLQNKVCCI